MGWRLLTIVAFFFFGFPAFASVGLTDRVGSTLPLTELQFVEETGKSVSLDSYFHHKKPVILIPVYYNCPGICNVVMSNIVTALKQVNSSAGHAFEVVVFSFDSSDTPVVAMAKKKAYVEMYARPETADGWHFLTGDARNIGLLTQSLGFAFEYVAASKQFEHPSAVFIVSPEGRTTSTLPGITYPHRELQVALFEASQGKIQIFINRVSAICYAYMPHYGLINSPFRWLLLLFSFFGLSGILLVVRSRNRRRR